MSGITVSIPHYVAEAFNLPVTLPLLQKLTPEPKLNEVKVREYNVGWSKKSRLGTFIYESIEFYDEQDNEVYRFPDTVLIDVAENPKNIVRTPIQGRNGTVKEYIGMDDWRLNIMGVLINPDGKDYPEQLIAELSAIYEEKKAFRVCGSGLNSIGIYNIVLSNLKFSRQTGKPNSASFVLEAYSDEPIELEILNS